jgi:hypothetical protein
MKEIFIGEISSIEKTYLGCDQFIDVARKKNKKNSCRNNRRISPSWGI